MANIKTATCLHDRAMACADQRDFASALRWEREAAMMFVARKDIEPTRSVLFRSAASLAISAGKPAVAVVLINYGLDGNPPAEIRDELLELLGSV